ncbi:MAG: glycosyltransferase [Erythrobacter sp.]|uniref:glycosyltransferase family 2 protein n=1 Tax=Erythrobacter sp. TaxID=1042 RepID=UPI0025E0A7BC|nr:glycosyltransferase [Erythrobacter sp.]MCL9999753.1 glycosyltransferase [Erythrobacter sp.]
MTRRIAIVTPYWQEPHAVLERCIASVAAQSVACDHLLVADGAAQEWLDAASVRHLRLDRNHADYGNAARGIGALLAAGEGYDAIGFLDADNRIDPDHVALCLAAAQAQGNDGMGGLAPPDVVIARRRFELPCGTPVALSDEPGLIDTNCLFLLPGAFPVIARWALIPGPLAAIGDRVFHAALVAAGCHMAQTARASVTYASQWVVHNAASGGAVPADARALDVDGIARWVAGLSPEERRALDRRVGAHIAVA